MATINATVKMGISNLSSPELVDYAQFLHDRVTGNANYTTPTPTMAVLQTSVDELEAANAAVLNGGKAEHQARRTADRALRALVKQLAGYVQMQSGGDEDKILSSGFEVRKRGTPVGELPPPVRVISRLTNTSGRVALDWEHVYGADLYHVYMSTSNNPFNWVLTGVTSKSRFNADSLESGTFYWFAITAVGTAGESSRSEPARAMAAA